MSMFRGVLGAAGLMLSVALPAQASMLDARPAMLVLLADGATVSDDAQGQGLVLTGVHPVVALVSQLEDDRVFHAFRFDDFAAHWNTCNELKHDHDLWHPDGRNAMLVFEDGAHPHDGVRMNAPLFTAPLRDDDTHDATGETGAVRLMLEDAAIDGTVLSFRVSEGAVEPGAYGGVMLLAECLI